MNKLSASLLAAVMAFAAMAVQAEERTPSAAAREAKFARGRPVALTIKFVSDDDAAQKALRQALEAQGTPNKMWTSTAVVGTKEASSIIYTTNVKALDPAVDAFVASVEQSVAGKPGTLSWSLAAPKK